MLYTGTKTCVSCFAFGTGLTLLKNPSYSYLNKSNSPTFRSDMSHFFVSPRFVPGGDGDPGVPVTFRDPLHSINDHETGSVMEWSFPEVSVREGLSFEKWYFFRWVV